MARNLDFTGLDRYTEKMYKRIVVEYPQVSRKFLENQINACKNDVIRITPRGEKPQKHNKSKHLQDNWKTTVKSNKGGTIGVLKNASPHAHLIENGHMTKNGSFVEGKHMLSTTITKRQPKIDRAIENLVDEIFDL